MNPTQKIERRLLRLDRALFNEAAKPPYAHLFAMTDLGNMLFAALKEAGCNPQFRSNLSESPLTFASIEIDVAVVGKDEAANQEEA